MTKRIHMFLAVAAVATLSLLAFPAVGSAAESDFPQHSYSGSCSTNYWGRYVIAISGFLKPWFGVGIGIVDGSGVDPSPYSNMHEYIYFRVYAVAQNGSWTRSSWKRQDGSFRVEEQHADGYWYTPDGTIWSSGDYTIGSYAVGTRAPAAGRYDVWVETYWDRITPTGYVYGGPLSGGVTHWDYLGNCSFSP